MMRAFAATLIASLTLQESISAFVPHAGWNLPKSSLLEAKAAKKKKKKKASAASGGGFGAKSANASVVAKKEDDDYAAFPALEPQVQETILPVQGQFEGKELPAEIYDRLEQIYGFDFNKDYASEDDDDSETASFGDMLSSSSESESILDRKPASAIDFGDLLSSSSSSAVEDSDAEEDLPLSSLPPFSDVQVLHVDPLVLSIDKFFTDEECDRYIKMSENPSRDPESAPVMTRSKTVGKDALAKAQRTSTTWFHHFKEVPELVAKASRLLGLDTINHWEEPQTVRYRRNEKFTWHLDALAPSDTLESTGGQRTATLLVYLTELTNDDGGATMFRDLHNSNGERLRVRPKKGSALLFFPAAGGIPNVPFDIRTLHCGEVVSKDASQDKWIAQLWLRKGVYDATAPPKNTHQAAFEAISNYCTS